MSEEKEHIVSYKNNFLVLIALLCLTFLTVAITSVELGPWNVSAAMLIASLKVGIVLYYFMHLKFEHVILRIMVIMVVLVFTALIVITFFDYLYR
ncbi:MAG: cytochrome C oxidase subunit IV family protein [Bacteroidales bacterium]